MESCKIDWDQLYQLCDKFSLRVFLECMNFIAMRYLMVSFSIVTTTKDTDLSEKIMTSILNDKDFVFGSGKGNWHNRLHLITNLFKYRWKYEEVYETSIWKQIWYYATGFIFKTE